MIKKFLMMLLIATLIIVVYLICRIADDCFETDGAATARVYCDILDDREAY